MRRLLLVAALVLLALAFVPVSTAVHPAAGPITISPVSPLPGGVTSSEQPTISATFSDSAGTVDPSTVVVIVNGVNVTGFQSFVATIHGFSYVPPAILKLSNGNQSVQVTVSDSRDHTQSYSWGFVVNTAALPPQGPILGINAESLVVDIIVGAVLVLAAFGAFILYLKRTRRFTFRKYFATHPINKEYLVLYVPLVVAFFVVIFGLLWVFRTPGLPLLAPEYVVILGMFIALTFYAIDARAEKARIHTYERAFAQFLFEMADAMRGGLDPAKAVVELSTTHTDILRKPLRVAADGIRVGRPFEAVIRSMVLPMRSSLITRYAELIADASSVGGETSIVIHRAAKDMDDFIKIERERATALVMPVAVLYVAFGVLMAVLFSLLSIAPSLGSVSLSFLGGGSNPLSSVGHSSGGSSVPKLATSTLTQRFFDLMMINALGTGVIIGAFTEGKAKYGLLHSLGLLLATVVAFLFFG